MSVIKWSYTYFSVRAKNSSGAVLLTWQPYTAGGQQASTRPVRIGPPTIEKEVEQRTLINGELRNYVLGYRVTLPVVWIVTNYYIPGAAGTGLGDLHNVLQFEQGGGYLEVTLDGSTWRRCEARIKSQTNLDGRNVGLRLEVDFVQTALKLTIPTALYLDW